MNFLNVDILNGLPYVLAVYIGFAMVYILNMVGGAIINCQIEKAEDFSLRQFLLSFEKVLFCAVVMGGLVCATNLISQGLFDIDESLSEVVTSVISIAAFALVFAKGFIQKALALMDKVKYMLEITDNSKVDLEKINAMTLEDLRVLPELEPDAEHPKG